jgi:hypothetical protein
MDRRGGGGIIAVCVQISRGWSAYKHQSCQTFSFFLFKKKEREYYKGQWGGGDGDSQVSLFFFFFFSNK